LPEIIEFSRYTSTYSSAKFELINDTQVAPEEILSYSLYYYDKEEDKVFICCWK